MQRRSYASDEGWLLSYADLITNLLIFFAMLLGAAEISRTRMQEIARELSGEEQPESLAAIQDEIDERIEREGLQDVIFTDLTDEGLELALNSGLMFDVSSAIIRSEQEAVLDRMLQTLVPYGDKYQFAVEGHTDSTPFGNGHAEAGRTNWELSTDRANAVCPASKRWGSSGIASGWRGSPIPCRCPRRSSGASRRRSASPATAESS